ncbi:hypothetical protein RRF57_001074 [Xylaria bambusicola]|uniref:Non-reducing end beta-L-arabinofuranosidase-like GH127 middle domain-containing protein n=1 Tax=Xylaria bambusicola TaxID=326684 RepID=A0AAN7Z369_9PEZI
MDSIYAYDSSSVYVNLFTPSKLNWSQRGVTITQTTTFPVGDTTTLTVGGSGTWSMKIRIPTWTSGATVSVNGQQQSVATTPGSYATISSTWKSGDTVTVKLPMRLRLVTANDNKSIAAVAYGPTILAGNYGSSSPNGTPTLTLDSLKRKSTSSLDFTGTANGAAVTLGPFYDAQGYNYVVYWSVSGILPTSTEGS